MLCTLFLFSQRSDSLELELENANEYAQRVLELQPGFTLNNWLKVMPDKYPGPGEHFIEGLRKAGLH